MSIEPAPNAFVADRQGKAMSRVDCFLDNEKMAPFGAISVGSRRSVSKAMLFPANDDPAVMILPGCGETAMITIMITVHCNVTVAVVIPIAHMTVAVLVSIARMTVAVLVTIADTHLDLCQLHVTIRDPRRAGERRRCDHAGGGGKNQSKLFHYDSPRGPLLEDDLRFDDLTWINASEPEWLRCPAIKYTLNEFRHQHADFYPLHRMNCAVRHKSRAGGEL
jgi:hypothetical protein